MSEEKLEIAVVLLSGGVDSAVCGLLCEATGARVHAVTFDYGQRHKIEIEYARRLARSKGWAHSVLSVPLMKGSALTAGRHDRSFLDDRRLKASPKASPYYVPARNTIFIAHAIAVAESLGAVSVWLGANADDRAGFPDCTEGYFRAWAGVLDAGIAPDVHLVTPLLHTSKHKIMELAAELGLEEAETWSCYTPQGRSPCGVCPPCLLRSGGEA